LPPHERDDFRIAVVRSETESFRGEFRPKRAMVVDTAVERHGQFTLIRVHGHGLSTAVRIDDAQSSMHERDFNFSAISASEVELRDS